MRRRRSPGRASCTVPMPHPFQALRAKMETEWVPQMIDILGLDPASLPIIWDADFLYGPRDAAGADSYILCEINVSSCFAIPDEAPAAIARLTLARCGGAPQTSWSRIIRRVGSDEGKTARAHINSSMPESRNDLA